MCTVLAGKINFYSEFSLNSCNSASNGEFRFLHACVGKGNVFSGASVGVVWQLVPPAFSVSPGCVLPAAAAQAKWQNREL